jgi:23S rRNA (guanosine2251-2'-O)-methyltransferase
VKQKLKKIITSNSAFWIGGKHAVHSAIANQKRKIHKLVLHEKYRNKEIINNQYIKIYYENDNFFKKIFNNEIPHQGYALLIEKIKENGLQFYLKNNKISNIVALDGITDPGNIGSIVRSAVAFNFDAILINAKDFNAKSYVLYKAASGAMENIIFLEVSNILNEIKLLKSKNFWVVGMDGEAKETIYDYNSELKNIVIFGSEHLGMRKILKDNCDFICKIPINKQIESLNVSNAAAISLSVLVEKRKAII